MKSHQQIKITINNNHGGYQKNNSQLIQWLQNITPFIFKNQHPVTGTSFLKTVNHSITFCLN